MSWEVFSLPNQESKQQAKQSLPESNKVDWEVIEMPEAENIGLKQAESWPSFLGRTAGRTLARTGEAIIGLPSDIALGALNLADIGIKKLTGKETSLPTIAEHLPTSENLKKYVTEKATGKTLNPESRSEKFYDDIIQDAATLFLPLKSKIPFKKAALSSLGKSTVGNTAQWAAEEITDSPIVGTAVKIGSMALASTAGGRKELGKFKDISYKDAEKNLSKTSRIQIKPEADRINALGKSINKVSRDDKSFLGQLIKDFNNLGENPLIQDLIDLKQSWNDYLKDPKYAKKTKDQIKLFVGNVNKAIGRYGSKNPKFYQPWQAAEELTGALQSTNYIQNLLAKSPILEQTTKNPIIKGLFGVIGGHHVYETAKNINPIQIATGAGVALAGREAARAYQLLSRSPIARQYYKNIIKSALKNDAITTAKNLNKLDKVADDFKFVD